MYVPLIPRLSALFKNESITQNMQYCAKYFTNEGDHIPGMISDIFDGANYLHLCEQYITSKGVSTGQKHFSGRHDLALGLSTDGFSPFRHRKYSAWPLLVYNYNLPPSIRFHHENVICVSVIPGPHSVKNLNSFIEPLICELEHLEQGV